jgi:DNA-directed RNA polymerase subunit H
MEDRALQTLKIILKNRGVEDSKFDRVSAPMEDTHMYTYGSVLIVFSEKSRVTEREFNNFLEFATTNGHSNGMVIISETKPSESVLGTIRRHLANRENPLVQVFELRHLQFDISAHRKVPKHRILLKNELDDVLKEFHAKSPTQFPRIDCHDPMARWIGARPGDVLEITGLCESSGENRRYRLCVESAADT